jgi:predicted acylesterase/phospholipase RssA
LVGSTSRGTQPEFAVVTGVSAGALLAPFAFLGADWNAQLTEIFTSGATDGLLQRRVFGAVFGSSLYSAAPLRRLIERYAGDDMIAAVASEAAKGRLLLVATTDLASGEPVIWDLGSVALHGGRDAKGLFQTLLLASASIPGMLPPVVVEFRSQGRTHVETHIDGGVTLPFFIAPAAADLPHLTPGTPHPPIVRVIIDGPLRDVPRRTHVNAFAIFRRSLSDGLSHVTRARLQATVEAMRQRGIALDYAAIPTSYRRSGAFDFDTATQRALFKYAAQCASDGRLWIRVRSSDGPAVAGPASVSIPTCPANDAFLGSLAALGY